MLRIHFEADDLARTRILEGPDPLWETLLSLHMLQGGAGHAVSGEWRASVRSRLDRSAGLLFALAPPRGYSVDFLTPATGAAGLDSGIEAVLSTPRAVVRSDLTELAAERRPLRWAAFTGGRMPRRAADPGRVARHWRELAAADNLKSLREVG
ncbi:hypothetical protein ILP97_37775 [Amycolatopsis sp. H6(2020)]|nr:hypothetical protein [Amycolatopsis sp. H6(2020)]